MPIRQRKAAATCDLVGLLNWVAHDDFGGPSLTPSELSAQIFGMPDNVEEIEVTQFSRSQLEDAAKSDILDALIDGEIIAKGHFSNTLSSQNVNWRRNIWIDHGEDETEVPANVWKYKEINWGESAVRYPNGEFILIRFSTSDVKRVWKLEEDKLAAEGTPDKGLDLDDVPAADRYVSRSDNQQTWEQAITSLDSVIDEFKKDHKFGNERANEKNVLLETLEAGRELLNDTAINVRIGIALILEPLKIVRTRVEKYVEAHPGIEDGLTVYLITETIKVVSKLLFGT